MSNNNNGSLGDRPNAYERILPITQQCCDNRGDSAVITCSACGKANQPTRKFCIRCGASLLMKVQEPKQKETSPAPESKAAPAAAPVRKTNRPDSTVPPEKLSVTTGDSWVRPSSVERDRFRTGERHTGKTELEKAREAFAIADKSDVETRMLRASEVRQLMAEASTAPQTPAAPPPRAAPMTEPPRPAPPRPARPIESAPPASAQKPPGVTAEEPAATPRPPSAMPPGPRPTISRNGLSEDESELETIREPVFKPAPPAPLRPPAPAAPAAIPPQRPSPSRVPQEAVTSRSSYSGDSRIRDVESDITHFNQQLQQFESELETTRSRLDAEVERFRAAAESKKTKADNLEDDLRRAKNEWSETDKDYRKAKSRRDKEVEDAGKRIEDQKKRVKNAEAAREKRIREIEKEKQV